MAEKIIAKLRVRETHFANPITDAAGIATASWELQPLTYRDDEISIVEADPEEDELFSHENDAPEDTDVVGQGLSVVGSFIKASRAQMAELMGGATTGADAAMKYAHSATKLTLKKAIKFVCYDGTEIVVPNASGYVNMSLAIGKGGLAKFPFKFRAMKASTTWDCDIQF